jgi:hypothetical protein
MTVGIELDLYSGMIVANPALLGRNVKDRITTIVMKAVSATPLMLCPLATRLS